MQRPRAFVIGLLAAFAVVGPGAGAASAQQPPGPDGDGSDYFVTIAARQCPTYHGHPREPRAQQHPGEPEGPRGGHAVHGRAADQPGDRGRDAAELHADHGLEVHARPRDRRPCPWPLGLAVDRHVAVLRPDITTLASVPERDARASASRRAPIAGATTIELTATQAELAAKSSSLWIQGGTPTDPVLAGIPAFADEFGFGALRCAIDNLNGDNVEWIQFPAGSRHVYCYAYYVTPPPTSGTIIIRKQVTRPAERRPDLHVRGQHLVHARPAVLPEGRERQRAVADVLPRRDGRRRGPVDRARARSGRLGPHGSHVYARRQYRHHRPGECVGVDRACGRRHRELPVHGPAASAARAAVPLQGHVRRRRDVPVHGGPRGRRADAARVRDDDRHRNRGRRRAGAVHRRARQLPGQRAPPDGSRRPLAPDRGQLQRPAEPALAHELTAEACDGPVRRRRRVPVREPLRAERVDRDLQADARRGRDDRVRDLAGGRSHARVHADRDHAAAAATSQRRRATPRAVSGSVAT